MDYDFITTCNWTSTGTFTMSAYLGGSSNVVTSHSLFYRKSGEPTWTETTNGEVVITSTGEWEIANDWNKSGDDVLTHSYSGITAIDSCTDVYFNETTLGDTVGNNFLRDGWRNCSNLVSMPSGFNMPQSLTTVGPSFAIQCWRGCTSLTSMPEGFNIPQGLTTINTGSFMVSCWQDCTSLTSMPDGFNLPPGLTAVGNQLFQDTFRGCTSLVSMPSGFNIPSGITDAGSNFFLGTWFDCTLLDNDEYSEPITFEFNASNVFGGTCPITPDSVTATKADPVNVEVNRTLPPQNTGNFLAFM